MHEATNANQYTLPLNMLLDYVDDKLSATERVRIEKILARDAHIHHMVQGIVAYYHQYGKNRMKMMNYLSEAQKRVIKELFPE